ncbi:hypothetical protein Y032_0011g1385 [Ancylostoma ceylanicum]|uniref:Uncharacterized protein n=1 Tax=Ancylostoma ceylanicum TaxID=53326 RepID=A0A016VER9_9BILA|nr:hypothetical protein Y032_0011g1385 [Ancylostoma ceylanicum]
MTAKDPNLSYFDELLFAKFAELDQKVALLREEMDSIAMLLERRKRIRDTSVSLAAQIIRDADRLPHWSPQDAWPAAAPQPVQEICPPTLAFGVEAEGRLYDADLPAEHDQPIGAHRRDLPSVSSRLTFHPYSRPTNNERAAPTLLSTKGTALPAFVMPDLSGIMESPSYLELLAEFEERRAGNGQPILLVEHDDGAEDPPSDPDDNIGAAGHE